MPLSESEQKILSDLEESFSRQDPRFARGVRQVSALFNARLRGIWNVAGFIVGLALLVVFLTQSIVMSLVGVLIMLLSCLAIARNLELKGRGSMSRQRRSGQ
jgi:hypothetical protein